MNSLPKNPVFIHLDVIDSTNNYAANLLKQTKVVNGTVVLTKRQEKGKGQRGASWQSAPDKNLVCSTIFHLDWPVKQVFDLNMIAALAISDVLIDEGISNVNVKWPNDVYVNGKKIAGILIETQLSGQFIKSAIIGIGLNVNQEKFFGSFEATSMVLEREGSHRIDSIAKQYWSILVERIKNYQIQGKDWLISEYYQRLLGFGIDSQFSDKDGDFKGQIKGVDEAGRLCIKKESGEEKLYQIKEVQQFFK